jgi:small subunit ribosomal protein S15
MKIVTIKSRVGTPWLKIRPDDVEKLIVELYKQGYSKSRIGTILRDQYGIPSTKLTIKKSISEVLEAYEIKEDLPEDLLALYKKAVKLYQHLQKERKDFKSKRAFVILENRIRSLIDYYKRRGKLPTNYEYDINKARLVVRI